MTARFLPASAYPQTSARPSVEDKAEAARRVDEDFPGHWRRDDLIEMTAVGVMQKRQHAEWKAQSAAVAELKMGEAA